MAYPRVSATNLNVRELTKKFEVNATVTQEPVESCDRKKPVENKVNVHRTHAFRLKSQNGELSAPVFLPKTAYAFGKRIRKVEDSQSVKSIVEKFDCNHVVPSPEKLFKDEYSKVLKKSPSCDIASKSSVSPKINTLRKTVSNITSSANSCTSTSERWHRDVEMPQIKHEPLQELVDTLNTNNNNLELTNSLKAALRSPLPKGPPPKKPPRTFAHKNESSEREATMTESRRKLVKLKEIVEGGKQSGGDVLLRTKSPILPRRTKEQATSIDGTPVQSSHARSARFVGTTPLGLVPGKLAMFRLCTACLSGGTTVRRNDYQELRRDVVVPEEHIYDVPFQSSTKQDIQQWPPAEFHCCKEKGLHYLCSEIVHNADDVRVPQVDGQKSLVEPH